jgi:hypothetical protein
VDQFASFTSGVCAILTIFFLLVDHQVILVGRSTRVQLDHAPLATDPALQAPGIVRGGALGPILLGWAAATGMAEALYSIDRVDLALFAGFPLLVSRGYVAGAIVAGIVTAVTMRNRTGGGVWSRSMLVVVAVVLGATVAETIAYGFRTQHGVIASGPAALAGALVAGCIGALCAEMVVRARVTNTERCGKRGDPPPGLPVAAAALGAALGVTLNWNLPFEPTWPIWASAAVVAMLWSAMGPQGRPAVEEPARVGLSADSGVARDSVPRAEPPAS